VERTEKEGLTVRTVSRPPAPTKTTPSDWAFLAVLSALAPASMTGRLKVRFLGCLQNPQNRCCVAKEVEPAVIGGDWLIGWGARTEKVAHLVVGTTEGASRSWALEPAHRTAVAFDAAMILLQSIVEILGVAMLYTCTQDRPDRTRITVVLIHGGTSGRGAGGHPGRLEERLRGRHVAVLAEHHVDQRTGAIDATVEIAPMPGDLDVGLIDVPASTRPAASPRRRRCRLSANAGVSLASQSRTAA
jgi:hypothetical protein